MTTQNQGALATNWATLNNIISWFKYPLSYTEAPKQSNYKSNKTTVSQDSKSTKGFRIDGVFLGHGQ